MQATSYSFSFSNFFFPPIILVCIDSVIQGGPNPSYQAGPQGVSAYAANTAQVGQMMPQVVAPTPPSTGFMPVNTPGVQRHGMNPVQPQSPGQPAPAQAAPTQAAPPPTVQTVDTTNVPGKLSCPLYFIYLGLQRHFFKDLQIPMVYRIHKLCRDCK